MVTYKQVLLVARYKQFFNAQVAEATRLQHRYDRETENGQLADKQQEWSRSTEQALRQLGISSR